MDGGRRQAAAASCRISRQGTGPGFLNAGARRETHVERVDAIVVGSGQGGVPLAADWAKEGQRVVLFERDRLGGSCINYGCTPSKAFLAAAHGAGRARLAAKLGVNAAVTVDFGAVMTRVRRIRDEFCAGVEKRLGAAGVRVVRAQASFVGVRTLMGGDVTATAP